MQTFIVKLHETQASGRVGPGGVLSLHYLPFPSGDETPARVESASEPATPRTSFVLGIHTGLGTVSEEFDSASSKSFWLREDETPAW